jgi:DNA-binding MurR/RpiR family transcriptional regulator
MLAEWIGATNVSRNECLIIIDVVPYAREASLMAELSKEAGRHIVVITDELCHWGHDYTDLVIHAPARNGLFLESTSALVAALNMLVHAVSESDPEATSERLVQWKAATRRLKVF